MKRKRREKEGRVCLKVCGSFLESETDQRGAICVARERAVMGDVVGYIVVGYIVDRRSRGAEIGFTRIPERPRHPAEIWKPLVHAWRKRVFGCGGPPTPSGR